MSGRFVTGLELAHSLYVDAVAPLLAADLPALRYSAALIGTGSEVLGYDTERSTDHDWGPRLQLFVASEERVRDEVDALLSERLPKTILGYLTHFVTAASTPRISATDVPLRHGVEIADLGRWFVGQLGFDPRGPIATRDWLDTPTQLLAGVTAGAVFHDGLGRVTPARAALAWYPVDVWRHILAAQWQRIAEEEAFVGRCAEVDDDLGSAVVAARLVRDVMRLQLLLHRRYPPYNKWLGTAFSRLPDVASLRRHLIRAMTADGPDREDALAAAYEHVANAQNQLDLAPFVDPTTRSFYDRPFRVLRAERFADALQASIVDPDIRALPCIGAIDQWVDNPAILARKPRSVVATDPADRVSSHHTPQD